MKNKTIYSSGKYNINFNNLISDNVCCDNIFIKQKQKEILYKGEDDEEQLKIIEEETEQINKNKTEIIIKILNYKICLNIKNLSQLKKIVVNSIDEAYFFIINEFKENKVIIKEIIINNKIIKLLFNPNNNIEKGFEIELLYIKIL